MEDTIYYPYSIWRDRVVCGGCTTLIDYDEHDLLFLPKEEIACPKGRYVCLSCPNDHCRYISYISNDVFYNKFNNKIENNIYSSIVGRSVDKDTGMWINRYIDKSNRLASYGEVDVEYTYSDILDEWYYTYNGLEVHVYLTNDEKSRIKNASRLYEEYERNKSCSCCFIL